MSDSNRESILYCPEVTPGTTPINATTWKPFPFTQDSFLPKYTYAQDETIRADRNVEDSIQTGATAEGNLNFTLRAITIDDIFQAILGGSWTSKTMTASTISVSSVDKSFNDSANGFAALGLGAGDKFRVAGLTTSGNDGVFTVATAAAGKITVVEAVTTEAAGDAATLTSLTSTLVVGTTKRTYSIQKQYADLTTGNQFDIATGVEFGQLDLTMAYGAISTGQLALMGRGWADSATSAVGSGTVAAWPATDAVNGTTDIIGVKVNGQASTLYFKSLALTINPNKRAKTAIGSLFPFSLGDGSVMASMKADAYFDDRSLENYVRSGAAFAMEFTITDGANSYDIYMPRCFATDRTGLGAQKKDDDIVLSLTIAASRDATLGSAIQITRKLSA